LFILWCLDGKKAAEKCPQFEDRENCASTSEDFLADVTSEQFRLGDARGNSKKILEQKSLF
jgi:hypothetical protein